MRSCTYGAANADLMRAVAYGDKHNVADSDNAGQQCQYPENPDASVEYPHPFSYGQRIGEVSIIFLISLCHITEKAVTLHRQKEKDKAAAESKERHNTDRPSRKTEADGIGHKIKCNIS